MGKIRVLVVDDAVVVRKILTDVLSEDPDIEIAGVAANGKIALQKIPQCNPDIITLDVEMPELSGIETVKKVRETYPKLPIIMFSTLTERGAETTLEALSAGATDYVTKPANVGSVATAKERIKTDMVSKIKELAGMVASTAVPEASRSAPLPVRAHKPVTPHKAAIQSGKEPVDIVAIGVSTGGPNALAELLPQFPADFPVPIVIVQHMPPLFTKLLAERLDAQCKLRAEEGAEGEVVRAGHIYLAPGSFHMEMQQRGAETVIHLHQGPMENSCRPAVDPLFRSVVNLYGGRVLGVILTGMGQDGGRGCECIKDAGGCVLAQDKESSVVWGMPGYVAEAGLADAVLPLNELAGEIIRRVQKSARINSGKV